jgi:hypothetical protein
MELPADVLIHNEQLGLKGGRGVLLRISSCGYYEVNCRFGDRQHRTYLPVAHTVIISAHPELVSGMEGEIER